MYQFGNWNANLLKLRQYLKRLFLGLNIFNFVLYDCKGIARILDMNCTNYKKVFIAS